MKLTLEPTPDFFMADGVMVRMWTGVDEKNRPVVALIAAVALTDGSLRSPMFGSELIPIPPPGIEEAEAWAERIMKKID